MLDTEKMKALREKMGLSMEEAAQLAGFTNRQQWFKIESGSRADVTLSTLDKIAAALGCSARSLIKAPPRKGRE